MMMQSGFSTLVLTIAMLAAFLLGGAGIWLLAKARDRKRGALMLAAAAVLLFNVAVWTWPV
jgi:thiol:disulfide interchange protein